MSSAPLPAASLIAAHALSVEACASKSTAPLCTTAAVVMTVSSHRVTRFTAHPIEHRPVTTGATGHRLGRVAFGNDPVNSGDRPAALGRRLDYSESDSSPSCT
ncbi:hypothetical protein GCM10009637_22850 [Brevibacterium luteolum]